MEDEITDHQRLIDKLNRCPTGRGHSTTFEKICEEVLKHLFVPPLKGPLTQNVTLSESRKRDFIFENRIFDDDDNWGKINRMFKSHLILLDAKNYGSKKITSDTVHDIKKYIEKPMGKFGAILSSKLPEVSATKEVLKIYNNEGLVIIIITKDELIEMIITKSRKEDPSELIMDKIYSIYRKVG